MGMGLWRVCPALSISSVMRHYIELRTPQHVLAAAPGDEEPSRFGGRRDRGADRGGCDRRRGSHKPGPCARGLCVCVVGVYVCVGVPCVWVCVCVVWGAAGTTERGTEGALALVVALEEALKWLADLGGSDAKHLVLVERLQERRALRRAFSDLHILLR